MESNWADDSWIGMQVGEVDRPVWYRLRGRVISALSRSVGSDVQVSEFA